MEDSLFKDSFDSLGAIEVVLPKGVFLKNC